MANELERLKTALAHRYIIERELGSGGMATVYLAEDLKLHRKVALKVLKPDLASALGPDRFLQEIDIAAQLTHPHILPLHDSGDTEGFLYYVMPYVEGQSLRDKLTKEGELPIAEAVRILRDVVDALSHAHRHSVVHRDVKPDNVMLAERHALVTDFGVAKAVSEATGAHKLTTEGVALGTPAYMAPEQAAADPHIDQRADIYAVGVIAYELLTGRTPFVGNTQQELLAAHVTVAPEPVTKYRESVPPALGESVMKCLEKKAADRWQTAGELLPEIEALATPGGGVIPTGLVPLDRRVKRRWMMLGGAVGVAAVTAVIVVMAALPRRTGVLLDKSRVAVLPFENLTGEDSLNLHGQVAASWITDGLQQVDILSVVPWMAVQQEANALEEGDPVRELAEVTGAGIVVSGSYTRQGDSLTFRAEITDAAGMELLHTIPPIGGLSVSPEAAFAELGGRVAGALAVMLDTVFGDHISFSLRQPSFAAYREHVTGLDLFSRSRFDEAIEHLTRAHELDTSLVRPLLQIAIAHANRGRDAVADSLTEMLEQRRDQLSTFHRQSLTWWRADLERNHLEALRVARELANVSRLYVYVAGLEAVNVNRPQEAVQTLERIDPTKGLVKEWIPYWDVLTEARHMLGDHRRELRDARRGREQHPLRRGAVEYEARALAALGRVADARVLFDEFLGIPPSPRWGHAYPVVSAALCFRAHGYPDAAQDAFQLALDRLSTHSPDEAELGNYRYNVGRTLYWSGRWQEARDVFLELVADNPDTVDYTGYLGVVYARLGDTDEASRIRDELAGLERPYLWSSNTQWQARIAALLGEREQAVELLRRAFNEGLAYGIWLHRDIDFEPLRDYPPFQELLRPKG